MKHLGAWPDWYNHMTFKEIERAQDRCHFEIMDARERLERLKKLYSALVANKSDNLKEDIQTWCEMKGLK